MDSAQRHREPQCTSPQPPPKGGEFPLLRRGRSEWHSGLKAQQSLAWGNALRHEIAGQVCNGGRYKNAFFNHYVQKSQKILIFLNVLMISHSKNNLL